jgi:hypothetical protein
VGESAPTRYRFGPLERRGLVAGWRGGQIGAVAGALVVGVGVLRMSPSAVGVVVALAALAIGVGVATWPIAGRTAEQWAPEALRHALTRLRGSPAGARPFSGVHLIRVDVAATAGGSTERGATGAGSDVGVGVLHDRTRRTFTAVLGASDPGFVLLGEEDKARRVSAWSEVLASLARDGSAVHRVQWIERVLPAAEMASAVSVSVPAATNDAGYDTATASYQALVEAEAGASLRHEVLLGVTVHAGRAGRAVKSAGGGSTGACSVLLREVAALRRRLADASIEAGAVLTPHALAAVVRGAYEGRTAPRPDAAPSGARRSPRPSPPEEPSPWPMGVAGEWSRLRVDGTWHATYWVAEWPRTDAGPDFLGPLLLSSDIRRTMSVVMEPLGPIEAARKVEQARTADIADAEIRRRGGFLATARRRREEEILERREVELADGHGQYRFSGYVTVSAPDPDALEDGCGRVEQAAGRAGLELRRCYGDQANTFMCTLPLGRGLA